MTASDEAGEDGPTVSGDGDVYYDPYDAEITADPYPVFRRLREEAPLYYNAQYDFYAPLILGACRYGKYGIYNASGQLVDTDTLDAWAYRQRVTDA